ncbi:hypothetical protein NC651_038599 [Populus alba x Populus x berolinensis]|nr:hypothetical protein NC651_038599 [Populus alba x Populus x berolinensis]
MDFVIRASFFLLWAILVALLEKIEKESGQQLSLTAIDHPTSAAGLCPLPMVAQMCPPPQPPS